MASFNIPNTQVGVGEQTFGPFSAPAGVQFVTFSFDPTVLVNVSGGFEFLSDMFLSYSTDGGQSFVEPFQCGIFSDPTFIDTKSNTTTCSTQFAPIPSPSLVRVRTVSTSGYLLRGASVSVS